MASEAIRASHAGKFSSAALSPDFSTRGELMGSAVRASKNG